MNKENNLDHLKTSQNISTPKYNEELEMKKPCVITEYNPVKDFNEHLENGFDSDIGTVYFFIIITIILTMKFYNFLWVHEIF